MSIVEFLTSETAGGRRPLLITASLAGLGNALVVIIVNHTAANSGSTGLRMFSMFVLSVSLYVVGAGDTYLRTATLVETALHRIRTRIVAKVERTELEPMERVGAVEIMDRITENISVISASTGWIAHLLQSLCIVMFATAYVAWLSLPAFVLIVLLIAVGASTYLSREKSIFVYLKKSARERVTFAERVTDLLKGFKEVKFSRRRGRDLFEDSVKSSELLVDSSMKANDLLNDQLVFTNVLQFAVLSALVLVLPRFFSSSAERQSALVASVLFLWASITGILSCYPAYVRSNHALAEIRSLEEKLDASAREAPPRGSTDEPLRERFTTIEARDIEYSYSGSQGEQSFHIGPINLTIEAGEILFIVGGNGSGKSTLLKVLTGLYPASAGALRVDDLLIRMDNVAAYREMISAIYSDFHLFAKLYGLLNVDAAQVHRLLGQMKIGGKTSFADHRFTAPNLSTGQRKRLAMVVALLEDRPLYVFDEWAADQDPEFRKYFYEELLPSLKQRGKTVIAVSHDDRYFRSADRVVTMEYGAIRSIERIQSLAPQRPDPGATSL